MTSMEMVLKMMNDFEITFGRRATEISLSPSLYDSLKAELHSKIPDGSEIDFIKLHGTIIRRSEIESQRDYE